MIDLYIQTYHTDIVKIWNKHMTSMKINLKNYSDDYYFGFFKSKNGELGINSDSKENIITVSFRPSKLIPNKSIPFIRFSLSMMPGCCAYCVSHDTIISQEYRNKGYGKKLQAVKKEIAKLLGFTAMICTVTSDNAAEIYILETHGWIKTNTIKNKRTGHVVYTYQYILDQQEEEMI
jgi:GNAT superfamily N-acetyltransferase